MDLTKIIKYMAIIGCSVIASNTLIQITTIVFK